MVRCRVASKSNQIKSIALGSYRGVKFGTSNNMPTACDICYQHIQFTITNYRSRAKLYVANSDKVVLSEEGVTQGGNVAMGYYFCSTVPVIRAAALSKTNKKADMVHRRCCWGREDIGSQDMVG